MKKVLGISLLAIGCGAATPPVAAPSRAPAPATPAVTATPATPVATPTVEPPRPAVDEAALDARWQSEVAPLATQHRWRAALRAAEAITRAAPCGLPVVQRARELYLQARQDHMARAAAAMERASGAALLEARLAETYGVVEYDFASMRERAMREARAVGFVVRPTVGVPCPWVQPLAQEVMSRGVASGDPLTIRVLTCDRARLEDSIQEPYTWTEIVREEADETRTEYRAEQVREPVAGCTNPDDARCYRLVTRSVPVQRTVRVPRPRTVSHDGTRTVRREHLEVQLGGEVTVDHGGAQFALPFVFNRAVDQRAWETPQGSQSFAITLDGLSRRALEAVQDRASGIPQVADALLRPRVASLHAEALAARAAHDRVREEHLLALHWLSGGAPAASDDVAGADDALTAADLARLVALEGRGPVPTTEPACGNTP